MTYRGRMRAHILAIVTPWNKTQTCFMGTPLSHEPTHMLLQPLEIKTWPGGFCLLDTYRSWVTQLLKKRARKHTCNHDIMRTQTCFMSTPLFSWYDIYTHILQQQLWEIRTSPGGFSHLCVCVCTHTLPHTLLVIPFFCLYKILAVEFYFYCV